MIYINDLRCNIDSVYNDGFLFTDDFDLRVNNVTKIKVEHKFHNPSLLSSDWCAANNLSKFKLKGLEDFISSIYSFLLTFEMLNTTGLEWWRPVSRHLQGL